MKAFFTKLARFAQLLDTDGNLSITNCGLILLLGKVMFTHSLDWPSTVTLILAFANYLHKRDHNNRAADRSDSEQMEQVKSQYQAAVVAQAETIKQLADGVAECKQLLKITDLSKLIRRG